MNQAWHSHLLSLLLLRSLPPNPAQLQDAASTTSAPSPETTRPQTEGDLLCFPEAGRRAAAQHTSLQVQVSVKEPVQVAA